jgi:hypothetical protein
MSLSSGTRFGPFEILGSLEAAVWVRCGERYQVRFRSITLNKLSLDLKY